MEQILHAAPKHLGIYATVDANYFIDASASEAMTVLAMGSVRTADEHVIVMDCLACAVRASQGGYKQRLLIIPWNHRLGSQKHNDDDQTAGNSDVGALS
jgi:hypothetical protein